MKNEGGYVLVSVLLAVILLSVLGGAYVVAMAFEVRSSHNRSDRVQAYYHARSGAEVGLEWVSALEEEDLIDKINNEFEQTLYAKIAPNGLSDEEKTFDNDIVITILFSDTSIEIESKGMFREAVEYITLILRSQLPSTTKFEQKDNFNFSEAPEIGDLPEWGEKASDLDWVQGASGVIQGDGVNKSFEGKVYFRAPGNSNKSKGEAFFQADDFYFISAQRTGPPHNPSYSHQNKSLDIESDARLRLTGKRITFENAIEIESGGNLCIFPKGEGSWVYFKAPVYYDSKEILSSGVYVIPQEGICLINDDIEEGPLKEGSENRIWQ